MSPHETGSIIAGKYRLDAVIWRGGMGVVYRAHHLLMDTPVALKLLHPELGSLPGARERFLREARAAARVRHPNVVALYDVAAHEDALFMVMEWLQGENFSDLMRRDDVPLLEQLRLLLGGMAGVAAAHEQGVIHRDIKPANIFVVRDAQRAEGLAKVLDFGIAKLRDDAVSAGLTDSGAAIGTPMYMSNEQMRGLPDVDPRADVYSFGVVLYEVLTGRRPFQGRSSAAIALEMHEARPRSVREHRPGVSAQLDHVVMKAIALEREQRFDDVAMLMRALAPVIETEHRLGAHEFVLTKPGAGAHGEETRDLPAARPSTPRSTRQVEVSVPMSRRRTRWLAVAVATLAVSLGIMWWVGGQGAAPRAPAASSAVSRPVAPSTQAPRVALPNAPAPAAAEPKPVSAAPPLSEPAALARPAQRRSRLLRKEAAQVQQEPAPAERPVAPSGAARGVRSGELRRDEL